MPRLEAPRFTFDRPDRAHVLAYLLQFDPGTHAAVGAPWKTDGAQPARRGRTSRRSLRTP